MEARRQDLLVSLRNSLELSDNVAAAGLPGYGRSLLYLVSRAYALRA